MEFASLMLENFYKLLFEDIISYLQEWIWMYGTVTITLGKEYVQPDITQASQTNYTFY